MGSVMLDNALSAEIGYKELANQGVSALDIPVVAFSVGEVELGGLYASQLVGHLAAWSYFRSIDTPGNEAFIAAWRAHVGEPDAVTFDSIESAYNHIRM